MDSKTERRTSKFVDQRGDFGGIRPKVGVHVLHATLLQPTQDQTGFSEIDEVKWKGTFGAPAKADDPNPPDEINDSLRADQWIAWQISARTSARVLRKASAITLKARLAVEALTFKRQ